MKIDNWDSFDEPSKASTPAPQVAGLTTEEAVKAMHEAHGGSECTYLEVAEMAKQVLSTLPELDRRALRAEMEGMTVEVLENPTTFQLTEALAKVQAYKDRLTTITNLVEREYGVRKRVMDMLSDANNVVSVATSADKRRGETVLRYPTLFLLLEECAAFKAEVANYVTNMRSKGETVSRQATLLGMQISLGEYRHKVPDDFRKTDETEERRDYKSGVSELNW